MTGWWFFDVPMWVFITIFSVSFWSALIGYVVYLIGEFFGDSLKKWWHEKVVHRYKTKSNSGDDTYMNPDDWGI